MAAAARTMDGAPVTLWVKREGDAAWAEVTIDSSISVARMTEEVEKKLKVEEGLDTLTLHVAADKEGKDLGAALDSTHSIEEALPQAGKIRIVIKAAGAAAPSVPAGVQLLCAAR
jgi:hypothetical protein